MRVRYDRIIRTADGKPNPAAQVSFTLRNFVTVPLPVYGAETGGSPLTQPLTPDADGKVTAWLPTNSNPLTTYSVLINHGSGLWQFYPVELFPVSLDAWTTLTLTSPWTNTAGTAAYTKSAEGIVMVRGLVGGGSASSAIATLPSGYRPGQDTAFSSLTTSASSILTVSTAGVITSGPTVAQTSLDAIVFQADI